MRHIIYIAILLPLAALWTTGCRGNDDGEPTSRVTVYDIVCLESVGDHGTTFTLTKPAGSELITYATALRLDTTRIKLKDRFMLAYYAPSTGPYTSGTVTPLGYSLITNDTLRAGYIEKIAGWDRDPVYMLSVWMSQDYLNMRTRLPYDDNPRRLGVMIDSLTMDREYPDCYLVHQLKEPINTFDRAYYISVDMAALRRLEHCRGFNLILNNSNLKKDRYTFTLN